MKYAGSFGAVASRLRARGFDVVEVAGWQHRGVGGGDFASIESVIHHHTATGGNRDYASLNLVTNGRETPTKLRGPLANFGVGRLGTIYLIAAGYANHAGVTRAYWQGNRYAVGIEAENNGIGEAWGPAITLSLLALTQELMREFKVPLTRVLGHKEICSPNGRKPDPSFDLSAFRTKLSVIDTITKEAIMAAVDEFLPGGNHYSKDPETLGYAVRELEPRIVGRVTTALVELEARLNSRIDAVPAAVVRALMDERISAPTFRSGVVVDEPTAVREILGRANEASAVRHLLTQKGII